MAISATQVGNLLTGAAGLHKNKLSDLVTGRANSDVTMSLLASQMSDTKLSAGQSKAIDSLVNYVSDNVKDDATKRKLIGDLTVIEKMLSRGNQEFGNSMADPVFALFTNASGHRSAQDLVNSIRSGAFINQLV